MSLGAENTSMSSLADTMSTAEYNARTVAFKVRNALGHSSARPPATGGVGDVVLVADIAAGGADGAVDELAPRRDDSPRADG
jgi:hypothetical protein